MGLEPGSAGPQCAISRSATCRRSHDDFTRRTGRRSASVRSRWRWRGDFCPPLSDSEPRSRDDDTNSMPVARRWATNTSVPSRRLASRRSRKVHDEHQARRSCIEIVAAFGIGDRAKAAGHCCAGCPGIRCQWCRKLTYARKHGPNALGSRSSRDFCLCNRDRVTGRRRPDGPHPG